MTKANTKHIIKISSSAKQLEPKWHFAFFFAAIATNFKQSITKFQIISKITDDVLTT